MRVGDLTYPALPRHGVGIPTRRCRVAIFALLYDQDLTTPIRVCDATRPVTRDGRPRLTRVPEGLRKSTIEMDDAFLQSVVPAILAEHARLRAQVSDPNDLRRGVPQDQRRPAAEERRDSPRWRRNRQP